MKRKLWLSALVGTGCLILLVSGIETASSAQNKGAKSPGAGASSAISGTGTLSGTVRSSKEFKSAKVYARNVEKNVVYMVFTENGKYEAIDLFPGTYEVGVTKVTPTPFWPEKGVPGGDVQKITITAGGNATLDLTLKDVPPRPNQEMRSAVGRDGAADEPLVSYDDLYPAGHAREIIERTCMLCHHADFLPNQQWDESQWNAAIDLMSNPFDNAGSRLVPGTFAPGEREELVAYLVRNFGPNSKKRGLAVPDPPFDEKALGKAMYMEYHLPPLPSGKPRGFHDLHLSKDGEVWYVDARGLQTGKMDPRTATWTDYAMKGPEVRGHGLTQDANGDVWVAGHTAFVRVDGKTGAVSYYPYDPNAKRPPHGSTPFVDSKQNIWTTLAWNSEVAKFDKATGEISRYKMPTDNSFSYGMVIDKSDNVWMADWWRCKATKFDPSNGQWIEYIPLSRPCAMRRVFADHNGMIWYALESPGKIGMIDPKTNKIVEYSLPAKYSFPYDIQEDHDNNLWIADSGQGGGVIKFIPQTKSFTYYPFVQRTDTPKIEISHENAVWYTTRSAPSAVQAIGVLYPDKTKIQTFSAAY
jgi:virginiamycin B lyase